MDGPRYAIGLDPDLHTLGMAVLAAPDPLTIRVLALGVARVSDKLTGDEAVSAMILTLPGELDALRERAFPGASLPLPGTGLVVSEGQQIHYKETPNPASILPLGVVSGASAALARMIFSAELEPAIGVVVPAPTTWKAGVPKPIHQARTYTAIDWHSQARKEYSIPSTEIRARYDFNEGDWKHLGDAIGLALWGLRAESARRFSPWALAPEPKRQTDAAPRRPPKSKGPKVPGRKRGRPRKVQPTS